LGSCYHKTRQRRGGYSFALTAQKQVLPQGGTGRRTQVRRRQNRGAGTLRQYRYRVYCLGSGRRI
jgi:hypothetical protein